MSRKSKAAAGSVETVARSWSDLVGYEGLAAHIVQVWHSGRLPQVLVFEGPEGSGKTKFLAQLSAAFYCDERRGCGHCDGCRSVQGAYQSDLFWLESEGSIKVADADNLQAHLNDRSAQATAPRLAVVVNLETMTDQAANRLLKTLEEPPPGTLIIGSCVRFDRLLATVRSRAVKWTLPKLPSPASVAWLKQRLLKADFSDKELEEALGIFRGAPGRALRYLEQEALVDRSERERLDRLLMLPLKGENLKELQELIKIQAWKTPDLTQHFERLINQSYRRKLEQGGSLGLQELKRIRHWRQTLQGAYRAGRSGQNTLNVQLVVEALTSGLDQ